MKYNDKNFISKRTDRINFNNLKVSPICPICNKKVSDSDEKLKQKLTLHFKKKHKLNAEQIIKQYYKSDNLCLCGCGNPVKANKWHVNLYYKDHVKNIETDGKRSIVSDNGLIQFHGIEKWLSFYGMTISKLTELLELYKKPEWNQKKISELSGVDNRTLKSWWVKANLIKSSELNILTRQHKYNLKYKLDENKNKIRIDLDLLQKIYISLLDASKYKVPITLTKLVNDFSLNVSTFVLYQRLIETYTQDKIDELLSCGLSSISETNFYYVLSFFYGKKNIKKQFKLNSKIYDFLLYEKILIEFDRRILASI